MPKEVFIAEEGKVGIWFGGNEPLFISCLIMVSTNYLLDGCASGINLILLTFYCWH